MDGENELIYDVNPNGLVNITLTHPDGKIDRESSVSFKDVEDEDGKKITITTVRYRGKVSPGKDGGDQFQLTYEELVIFYAHPPQDKDRSGHTSTDEKLQTPTPQQSRHIRGRGLSDSPFSFSFSIVLFHIGQKKY